MLLNLCLLLVSVESGSVDIGEDITFSWNALSWKGTVYFSLTYPMSLEIYDWMGVYQGIGDDDDELDGYILTEDGRVYDIYTDSGDLTPDSDVDQGGVENYSATTDVVGYGGTLLTYWSRDLDTGDEYDIVLGQSDSFRLMLVFGYFDDEGDLIDPEEQGLIYEVELSFELSEPEEPEPEEPEPEEPEVPEAQSVTTTPKITSLKVLFGSE